MAPASLIIRPDRLRLVQAHGDDWTCAIPGALSRGGGLFLEHGGRATPRHAVQQVLHYSDGGGKTQDEDRDEGERGRRRGGFARQARRGDAGAWEDHIDAGACLSGAPRSRWLARRGRGGFVLPQTGERREGNAPREDRARLAAERRVTRSDCLWAPSEVRFVCSLEALS